MVNVQIKLPDPSPFYPHCLFSLVESIAKSKGLLNNIDRAYFGHTFDYKNNNPDKIIFKNNQLDISLSRERDKLVEFVDGTLKGQIPNALKKFYGVETTYSEYTEYNEYINKIRRMLSEGEPVITQSSLGFISTRRQYKKVYGKHYSIIHGETESGFNCLEQRLQPDFNMSHSDNGECFDYLLDTFGPVQILHINGNGEDTPLDKASSINTIENSLSNLNSSDTQLGISGLRAFQSQYSKFYRYDHPTFVPDSWIFSNDRIVSYKWVNSLVDELYHGLHTSNTLVYQNTLKKLHSLWLNFDLLCEQSIVIGDNKFNSKIHDLLSGIVKLEEIAACELECIYKELKTK